MSWNSLDEDGASEGGTDLRALTVSETSQSSHLGEIKHVFQIDGQLTSFSIFQSGIIKIHVETGTSRVTFEAYQDVLLEVPFFRTA
jgi:hypothetical protein